MEDTRPAQVMVPRVEEAPESAEVEKPEPTPVAAEPEVDPLVFAATAAVLTIHKAQPECGNYCTSFRQYRRHIPDYSGYIVTEDEAWTIAESMVRTHRSYNIPLEEVMATAYQESRFRRRAIGYGTECGMYQQSTTYFWWGSRDEEIVGSREPLVSLEIESDDGAIITLEDGEAQCAYLFDLDNAGWQFAMKYHYLHGRYGSNWATHYNGGPEKHRYQNDHDRYAQRLAAHIERVLTRYESK